MTRNIIFCSICLLLASGFSGAQESVPPALTVGLFDVPRLALSNSLAERQRQIDIRIKRMGVKNQLFEYFPDLSLRYAGEFRDLFEPDESVINHNIYLSSTWDILKGGDRWLDQKIKRLEYEDLLLANSDDSQKEVYTALTLYLDCLKKKLKYESSLSNESLAKMQADVVTARKAQGRASELDILNARAEADTATYETAAAKMEYDLSLFRLSSKLRVGPVELPADPVAEIKTSDSVGLKTGEMNAAISELTAFKRLELGRKILKVSEAQAFKRRFIPYVFAGLNMDWYRGQQFIYASPEYKYWREDSFDGTLYFGASFPLFEKNSDLNVWRKFRLQLEKQALGMQETKEWEEAVLIEAVQNHDNELLLVPVAERGLESSRLNYEKMAESYSLGVGSLLDLYLASQKYRQSKESLIGLKVDLVLLRARIGYLLGDTMKYLR